MTLRIIEGFDYIPAAGQASAQTARILSELGYFFRPNGIGGFQAPAIAAGRFAYGGELAVFYQYTGGFYLSPDVILPLGGGATIASGVVGAAVRLEADANTPVFIGLYDALAGVPQVSASFHPLGVVKGWRGFPNTGTLLGSSEIGAFDCGTRFYAELKALIDPAAGTLEIRVGTVAVISLVAANTQASGRALADSIILGTPDGGGCAHYGIDDVYCCDLAGSENNDFLGNVRVQALLPAGPGDVTDFTASNLALANWQCALNEVVDDSLYVFDPTIGDDDLYALTPLVNNPTVLGVQTKIAYRQTDATQRFVKNQLKASGSTVRGASTPTDQTYAFVKDIQELNPGTGVAFTGAEVNAAQVGPYIDA